MAPDERPETGQRFPRLSVPSAFYASRRRLLCLLSAILICALPVLHEDAQGADRASLPQGWDSEDRDWFYSFSQGSQLLPYEWARALEVPQGQTLFLADGLARFGYIPRPEPTRHNPDALPIGFALDRDRAGNWFGMNCAACHTGTVEHGGRTLQVDGAPGNGDLYGLLDGLKQALRATLDDPAKFQRFHARLAAADRRLTPQDLRAKLAQVSAEFEHLVRISTPDHPWGPARTDAFGMIFNRVSSIYLKLPGNAKRPSAPVSYPFLWTTNDQDRIQWNGSVPNTKPWERMGRNVGQVLGVFGKMPHLAEEGAVLTRFESSARGPNLLILDKKLGNLQTPKWPGPIDASRAARGAALYQNLCASCHVDANKPAAYGAGLTCLGVSGAAPTGTADRALPTCVIPLDHVGTDPLTATSIVKRTSDIRPLNSYPNLTTCGVPGGSGLPNPTSTAYLLSLVVKCSILERTMWRPVDTSGLVLRRPVPGLVSNLMDRARKNRMLPAAQAPLYVSGLDKQTARYKAGPLNGIWATGPYLHNGSVPTLADLLAPAEERPKKFRVGSRRFDDQRVGFESGPGSGTFEFDTALPGNGNAGHEGQVYGTVLSPEERRDLLEYLKRL